MNPTVAKILSEHRRMLGAAHDAVEQGGDVDEVMYGHVILHAFSDELASMDGELVDLDADTARMVGLGVLEDMCASLDVVLDALDRGEESDFDELGDTMASLFRELASCIPHTIDHFRTKSETVDMWVTDNPDVLEIMLEETQSSALEPYELLEAMVAWTASLSNAERNELTDRFNAEPAVVVREVMRRAELARQLEQGFDEAL